MSEIYFMGFEARKAIRPAFDRRKIRTPDLGAASQADGHKCKLRPNASDGRLLPPRRKAYQSKEFKSPPDEN
jgi:hypothetical protein